MEAHLAKPDSINDSINELEKFMLDNMEVTTEKLRHIFTPGLYAREFTAAPNTLWISREHRTEHIFIVSSGSVTVWIDGVEQFIEAPHIGITKPGTRRTLLVGEDGLIWTTFHANPENKNENEIVEWITEEHNNPLFTEQDKEKLKEIRSGINKQYLTH